MAVTNIFEPENLIVDILSDIFPSDMVITGKHWDEIDNLYFVHKDVDSDKIGCVVQMIDFSTSDLNAKKSAPKQKYMVTIRVAVVCPKERYNTIGGGKVVEIIETLRGVVLDEKYTPLHVTPSDEIFCNFSVDIAYIPINIMTSFVL